MCYIQRIVCIRYIGFNYHEVVNKSLFEEVGVSGALFST